MMGTNDRAAVGYLESSPGVRSSARLLAVLCWALTALCVVGMLAYIAGVILYLHQPPAGEVLLGFAGVITALGGWGAIAMVRRTH